MVQIAGINGVDCWINYGFQGENFDFLSAKISSFLPGSQNIFQLTFLWYSSIFNACNLINSMIDLLSSHQRRIVS
ncbi:MAG: hypothetical protein A2Y94_12930 [Caldithrix sp. RBG_13_44_9]|nr:MAG: hypothetical protein A2Y94_12930 [Caldithrix sp. RBG_13_44_9]